MFTPPCNTPEALAINTKILELEAKLKDGWNAEDRVALKSQIDLASRLLESHKSKAKDNLEEMETTRARLEGTYLVLQLQSCVITDNSWCAMPQLLA